MLRTTYIAEAMRLCRLEYGPESYQIRLSAVKLGDIAFVGLPCEPFTGIGVGIKEAEGWGLVCPCCLTNGSNGYVPMRDSYIEGGYEAKASALMPGSDDIQVDAMAKLLNDIKC